MEVVGSKGSVTLGALPLPRLVPRPDALGTKDVEALGQNRVFLTGAATGAVQFGLWEREGRTK